MGAGLVFAWLTDEPSSEKPTMHSRLEIWTDRNVRNVHAHAFLDWYRARTGEPLPFPEAYRMFLDEQ